MPRDTRESAEFAQLALMHVSPYDGSRRVYRDGDQILKVRFGPVTAGVARRAQPRMTDEFELLRKCRGIRGIPEALEVRRTKDYECLVLQYIPGQTLTDCQGGIVKIALTLLRLILLVVRLACRGVSHNDILPQNIVVGKDGRVHLIDFDQATEERPMVALLKGVLGVTFSSDAGYGSVMTTARRVARTKMNFDSVAGTRQAVARRLRAIRHPLPRLRSTASDELQDLHRAWQLARLSRASSPETAIAYYSVEFDGLTLPGERAWSDRWSYLRSAVSFDGKRVLELGCNVGLLSIFAVKEGGASAAKGGDVDPKILEAARLAAKAYRVDVSFDRVDFDSAAPWEEVLKEFRPDLVTALNVMNWVADKDRLARFLGNFEEVLYEGHDSFAVECERLRKGGLTDFDYVATSERNRPVIFCTGPGRDRW